MDIMHLLIEIITAAVWAPENDVGNKAGHCW